MAVVMLQAIRQLFLLVLGQLAPLQATAAVQRIWVTISTISMSGALVALRTGSAEQWWAVCASVLCVVLGRAVHLYAVCSLVALSQHICVNAGAATLQQPNARI